MDRVPAKVIKEMTVSIKRSDSFKTVVEQVRVKKECKINRERRKSADSITSGNEVQQRFVKEPDIESPPDQVVVSPPQITDRPAETVHSKTDDVLSEIVEQPVTQQMISNSQAEVPSEENQTVSNPVEESSSKEIKLEDARPEEQSDLCSATSAVNDAPIDTEPVKENTIEMADRAVDKESLVTVSETLCEGSNLPSSNDGTNQVSDREGSSSMDSSPCFNKRSAVRSLHRGHPAFARATEKRLSETSSLPPGNRFPSIYKPSSS